MSLGKQITKYRKSKNYSQQDLAKQLKVSRQTISRWEADLSVPSMDKLNALCILFSISIDELLDSKNKKEDIDTKQIMALITKLNTNQLRVYKKFHLIFKSSILIIGLVILIIITYTFLSNDYNQNNLIKIEKSTQELNNQITNQQETLIKLENKLEEITANSPVKDYLITFSDVTDYSTNILIKAWLQKYDQNSQVAFNIEDVQGKKYYIPAKLENDYYICDPYQIDLVDIEKIRLVVSDHSNTAQEFVCNYIDISNYTTLNFQDIKINSFYYTVGVSDEINIYFYFGVNLNKPKHIETKLNLDTAYLRFYVNNKLAFKEELAVFKNSEPTPNWPYVSYKLKDKVKYKIKSKEKVYMEVVLKDTYGKETIYKSQEYPNTHGRIYIQDGVMEEVKN